MEAKYNFQYSPDKTEVTLFDFNPKIQSTLDSFIRDNKFERLFYFQNNTQSNLSGEIYSHFYYSKDVRIDFRNTESKNFIIEKGVPADGFEGLKQFAISLNKDEVIFPMSYIDKFKKNSLDIKETDLSIQIYSNNDLIGHASVIKTANHFLGNENLFLLMRFLVHENFRKTEVKEMLLREISYFLPPKANLFLQVFPKNKVAINFFQKRLHVDLAFTKMLIKHE